MSERISPDALIELLAGDAPPLLLDVRGAEKFAAGHLPGARHLPLAEIKAGPVTLPEDRLLVTY